MARAPYEELLTTAATGSRVSKLFNKYYNGNWDQPGLGGLASETFPNVTGKTDGDYQIVWSAYRNRFIAMVDNGQYIAYGESVDGLYWPAMQVLYKEPNLQATIGYANAVGLGEDPAVLGDTFYSYYTDVARAVQPVATRHRQSPHYHDGGVSDIDPAECRDRRRGGVFLVSVR